MMNEIWKDIEEFKGNYQVSNTGRVRRIKDYSNQYATWNNGYKILTARKHSNGYLRVMLSINGKHYDRYIHRLVAQTFIDNPNNYAEINHIDGNKKNNRIENLEWCNRSHNNKHAYQIGLHTLNGCYGKKKPVAKIDIRTDIILDIYESVECAAKAVGLKSYSNISACCNYAENPQKYKRPVLTCKGYKWKFIKEIHDND